MEDLKRIHLCTDREKRNTINSHITEYLTLLFIIKIKLYFFDKWIGKNSVHTE